MMGLQLFLPFLIICCFITVYGDSSQLNVPEKVCYGTDGTSFSSDVNHLYNRLRGIYDRCTHVHGNLGIVFLDETNRTFDLSFLHDIQEVTGYVLFMGVHADSLSLPNLRIIRGQTLYRGTALFIQVNYQAGSNPLGIGLKELGLTSLHAILAGDVMISNNNQLCYEDTIEWQDIIAEGAEVHFHDNRTTEEWEDRHRDDNVRECPACHQHCDNSFTQSSHCWGAGPNMCQTLTRVVCSDQCEGHCFDVEEDLWCCHSECVGGCDGPLNTDCWSCKHFSNEGECVRYCPPMVIYNPVTYRFEPNPNGKLAYGSLCVTECPDDVFELGGACVKDCGPMMYNEGGKCVPCGGACPTYCDSHAPDDWVTSENIGSFENCTVIRGSLRILQVSFDGYSSIAGITVDQMKSLESVKEIQGYLRIEGGSEDLKNLTFLRNLEIIRGQELSHGVALTVLDTPIETLELTSLRNVHGGHVYIYGNPNLCLANATNFMDLLDPDKKVVVTGNRDPAECAADGFVCNEECDPSYGCWGLGPEKCVQCANFRFGDTCLSSCDEQDLLYDTGDQSCETCHQECAVSCSGPGQAACHSCRHFQNGPYCVAECPSTMYPDNTGHCMTCHPFCDQAHGCTGPLSTQSEVQPGQNPDEYGGCYRCIVGLYPRVSENWPSRCLDPNLETCPVGYYMDNRESVRSCHQCHELCMQCDGPIDEDCSTCAFARQGDLCAYECDEGYYVDPVSKDCLKCDSACATCDGPTASSCIACEHHRVYVDDSDEVEPDDVLSRGDLSYYCVDECPDHKPDTSADDPDISNDLVCTVPEVIVEGSRMNELLGRE